jgi:hypothetical protein
LPLLEVAGALTITTADAFAITEPVPQVSV